MENTFHSDVPWEQHSEWLLPVPVPDRRAGMLVGADPRCNEGVACACGI